MAKYLFAYKGGAMADTEAEQQAAMAKWGSWFGALGSAIVDPGAPFGPSSAVGSDGSVTGGGGGGLSGYSVIDASDIGAASEMAKGCPVLEAGGSVEVYEAIPVAM